MRLLLILLVLFWTWGLAHEVDEIRDDLHTVALILKKHMDAENPPMPPGVVTQPFDKEVF